MTDPRRISVNDFDYLLPEEKIATRPGEKRDGSRLLIWRNERISDDVFRNVSSYLPEGALIVFNDTRVIEARLLFKKPTGATIEIFCLEPDIMYPDISTALAQTGSVTWRCFVGNASSWNQGLTLEKTIAAGNDLIWLRAAMIKKESDYFIIKLWWTPERLSFAELLHQAGAIPLPPYIKRKAELSDSERYQTVYAHLSGSVAAPTAGLHFTNEIIDELAGKNIRKDFVTLHVAAGTFKPVKAGLMNDHEMHAESIEVSVTLLQNVLDNYKKNIIAVGTTSLRTLESLYWLGKKVYLNDQLPQSELHVQQWQPYEGDMDEVPPEKALQALMEYIARSGNPTLTSKTSLLIAPGYQFKIVKILITNFHQPKSTLLLLVAAFAGEKWKSIYDHALTNEFRFLSYGDACLLFRQ